MSIYNYIPLPGFPKEKGIILDKKAICFWVASGFMLNRDSFWEEVKWHSPFPKLKWKYAPRAISFDQAVAEFAQLFHEILEAEIGDKKPILALSGGLDSRTLATGLKFLKKNPFCYSYRFKGSFKETAYGNEIARKCGWEFNAIDIPEGYLWEKIEEAAELNHCYAEFTHARQVHIVEDLSKKGEVWVLGHWGDVLFDDMKVPDSLSDEEILKTLKKKVLKKGGAACAKDLWASWDLPGDFDQELDQKLSEMLGAINIENANAKIRAFKSMYWATRWTTTNLSFFAHHNEVSLPYYHDKMCEFIMGIPEEYLAGRKIQIAYIKKYAPELAKISWQDKAPYNLYNFNKHKTLAHFPYRIKNKIQREINQRVLGKKLILRNWENQFIGGENAKHLESWLFANPHFSALVPKDIVEKYYDKFKYEDQVYWSHPVSMLLTLSVFAKQNEVS